MSTACCERRDPELERILGELASSALRKAGLRGAYAGADCELGRRVASMAREGRGAYLWGQPGTGKTWAAACAVRLAVEAGGARAGVPDAWLVTSAGLLGMVRDGYGIGDCGALERACRVGLLALDDLGAERATPWAVETLTRLVDARCSAGLPTVVTSNWRIGQMRDRWGGMEGKRLASRLAGACAPIEVAGPDRRLAAR